LRCGRIRLTLLNLCRLGSLLDVRLLTRHETPADFFDQAVQFHAVRFGEVRLPAKVSLWNTAAFDDALECAGRQLLARVIWNDHLSASLWMSPFLVASALGYQDEAATPQHAGDLILGQLWRSL